MSEMVERVAEALADWITDNRDALEEGGGDSEAAARVALAAMREPTQDMIPNGFPAAYGSEFIGYDRDGDPFVKGDAVWRQMIDAALAPRPTKP